MHGGHAITYLQARPSRIHQRRQRRRRLLMLTLFVAFVAVAYGLLQLVQP